MKFQVVALSFVLILTIAGCGGSSDATSGTSDQQNTLYLAKNIVFDTGNNIAVQAQKSDQTSYFSFISTAHAATVDSTTIIPAANVILDTNNTTVVSGNIQDAFDEVLPVVSNVLPGTWGVKSYNNGADGQAGTVTFFADNTFTLDSGTATVIGGCSLGGCFTALDPINQTPVVAATSGTWELVDNSLIKITLEGNSPQYVLLLNYTKNKLTSLRASNLSIFERI